MNERLPQHDSEHVQAERAANDRRLTWAVSDALLQAVYDIAERPGTQTRAATELAAQLAQLTSDNDPQAQATVAEYISGRILELVSHHAELATTDLQSIAEALAIQLIRGELSIKESE